MQPDATSIPCTARTGAAAGNHLTIISLLAIDPTGMSVAGGIVLFLIALLMIFPVQHSHFGDSPEGEPFIVPLAGAARRQQTEEAKKQTKE